jgi:hypothetical protein
MIVRFQTPNIGEQTKRNIPAQFLTTAIFVFSSLGQILKKAVSCLKSSKYFYRL